MVTKSPPGIASVAVPAGYPKNLEEFVAWAMALYERGWHPIPIGREAEGKPPGKVPWFSGLTGFNGVDAQPYQFQWWPQRIHSMIRRGIPGVLMLGTRFPIDVLGIDVDDYIAPDGTVKIGLKTLTALEAERGPLPPTYRVTSRPYDSGSGIRLYRVPGGWHGPDRIDGDIEFLDRFHRLMAVPPSIHHTGNPYRLYDERTELEIVPGILPPTTDLPELL